MVEVNNTFQEDTFGLSKPFEKVADKIGSAAGTVYEDLFKTSKERNIRKVKAESEASIIKAKAENEVKNIQLKGILERLAEIEKMSKLSNLKNVFGRTRTYLANAVIDDKPIDEDWIRRFILVSEDTSDEDIQDILAKIFAEEGQRPGGHSKRLLDYLRSTNKKELELFMKFATLSSDIGLYHMGNIAKPNSLKNFGLSTYDLICLADYGLIRLERDLSSHFDVGPFKPAAILFIKTKSSIAISSDEKRHVQLGIYPLTEIGKELSLVLLDRLDSKVQEQYIVSLVEFINKMGLNARKEPS